MARQQARPDALPPKWGRDAMRRAAVFCGLLAGSLALGSAVAFRVFAPPTDAMSVSAIFEQAGRDEPGDSQLSVDSEGLRKAIAQSERIEVALQTVRLPKSYDLHLLASRVAVRLSASAVSKAGAPACRVTLDSTPGLTARQAAALLNTLLEQYVDDLRRDRVTAATRRHEQAQVRLDEARRRLGLARSHADQLIERLADAPPPPPAASNVPAAVPEVLVDKEVAAAQRAEAERQWVELRARREVLLERRTPAHPEVLDMDERIAAVAARLEALQHPRAVQPLQAAPEANRPATMDTATMERAPMDTAARQRVAQARAACQRMEMEVAEAGQAEREAHVGLVQAQAERREVVTPAVVPSSVARQPLAPWLLATLAGSLLLACGGAMLVRPAAIRTPAEAQRLLAIPVIGVLPAGLSQPARSTAEAA